MQGYSTQGCALAGLGGPRHLTFSWVTRKSKIFHTNHMLGSLDFTGSENWAPFNVPYSTALFEELARFNLGGGTFLERRLKESGHF